MNHYALSWIAAAVTFGSFGCARTAPLSARTASVVETRCSRTVVVRAEAGAIWAGRRVVLEPSRAWPMPSRGAVTDLIVTSAPARTGYVVTFRQGGTAWQGMLGADYRARGPLSAFEDPGDAAVAAVP